MAKKMKKTTKKSKKTKKGKKVMKKAKRAQKAKNGKKTKAKKKVKKVKAAKKMSVKKPAKKVMAKKPMAMTPMRSAAVTKAAMLAKKNMIGKVVHYYDKIGVAIIDLQTSLTVGQTVMMTRGEERVLTQQVQSMQMDHQAITTAKKGDIIGIKVGKPVPEGTWVVPA